MNDQVKEALSKFLDKIIQGLETAGQFAYEQVPDVVQQALTWFMVESLVFFTLGLVFLWLAYWINYKIHNKKNGWVHKYYDDGRDPNYYYKDDGEVACGIVVGVILFLSGVWTVACNLEWLKILVAPKWFIVSEMSKLIT